MSRNDTLVISRASAGSGKTYNLTKNYIIRLFETEKSYAHLPYIKEKPHRRTLAVTFTNKATDEMKSRILSSLFDLSRGDSPYMEELMSSQQLSRIEVQAKSKYFLTAILHDYSRFNISTIDKFFQQILRSFAREIGIGGGYNLELNTDMILQQAVDNLYWNLTEGDKNVLFNWMESFMNDRIREGKNWNVKRDILKLGREIFTEGYQHEAANTAEKLHDKKFLSEYRNELVKVRKKFENDFEGKAKEILEQLADEGFNDPSVFSRGSLHSELNKIINKAYTGSRYSLGSTFIKYADGAESCYPKRIDEVTKSKIHTAYKWLGGAIREIIELAENRIAEFNSATIILNNINTLGILSDLALEIQRLTHEQNLMLLSDTNRMLHEIIDGSDAPFIYERTGLNFDHYMIDEFQDTSVLQWANFLPLIRNSLSEGKYNMVVGDVKQSIYRWRNSDWKLLSEQVERDLRGMTSENSEEFLINRRSDSHVIEFNNIFFEVAPGMLQNSLNSMISDTQKSEKLDSLRDKITGAYSDYYQEFWDKNGEGYVQIDFIEDDKSGVKFKEQMMAPIPALLKELTDRGYKPNDITFLVRTNGEANLITEFLLNHKNSEEAIPGLSYEVVGREGLKLNSSDSVNFILSAMRLAINSNDNISKLLLYKYHFSKNSVNKAKALERAFREMELEDGSSPFTEGEAASLEQLSRLPLFDAVENLIKNFGLAENVDETIFLQAFQDVIFKFTNSKSADLNSFLQWWDEFGDKQNVDIAENEQAYKIMTIHSAKGLEFKVTIIPFALWETKTPGNKADLIWCKTDVEPYGKLPIIPVRATDRMAKSVFSEDFINEVMHQYVDNLNVAYVAFTRAVHELYIFAKKSTKPDNKTISDLLQNIVADNKEKMTQVDDDVFCLGEKQPYIAKKKEVSDVEEVNMSHYPIAAGGSRLSIRRRTKELWREKPIGESRINWGILMHEILQNTVHKGDEERAVTALLHDGVINETEAVKIRQELEQFWLLPQVSDWFDETAEVLNERTILQDNGVQLRPDRIVLRGNRATVIDYKFGQEKKPYYRKQVERYKSLLTQMGYDTEGYLYYVALKEVEEVD